MHYDDDNNPGRRHTDARVDDLERRMNCVENRQDNFAEEAVSSAKALRDITAALERLTNAFERALPLVDAYEDVKGAARVLKWLVENAKTIAFIGACVYAGYHSPQVMAILGV